MEYCTALRLEKIENKTILMFYYISWNGKNIEL